MRSCRGRRLPGARSQPNVQIKHDVATSLDLFFQDMNDLLTQVEFLGAYILRLSVFLAPL